MSKKYICSLLFSIAMFNCVAQIPVMNPISGPANVCSSPAAAMNFTASASNAPTSYQWSISTPSAGVVIGTPTNAATSISFPYSNATYTIYCSATNGFGTSPTTSFVVNIFETPTVTFSGANSFCQGSSTNIQASSTILMASPTISYSWTPAYGLNFTNIPNVTANPTISTTYTVTGTKGSCSNASQITVTVLPLPSVFVTSNNDSICEGETATITISGNAISYSLNALPTLTSVVISPLFNTIYTVTGENAFGCLATDTLAQNVYLCVGIRSINARENNHLEAYPNPSNGSFNIRSGRSETVIITDELGQTVQTVNLKADTQTKINGLNSGIYFISTSTSKLKVIVIQ